MIFHILPLQGSTYILENTPPEDEEKKGENVKEQGRKEKENERKVKENKKMGSNRVKYM